MVQELTITATLGVTVMIITNKMLLPILLSYRQFSPESAQKLRGRENMGHALWEKLGALAERKAATGAIAIAVLAALVGFWYAKDLKGWRPRCRRAGTAPRCPLQQGRRRHHQGLRDRRRPAADHCGGQQG
jgi:hypothetical protein